jgi:hypothetical protein
MTKLMLSFTMLLFSLSAFAMPKRGIYTCPTTLPADNNGVYMNWSIVRPMGQFPEISLHSWQTPDRATHFDINCYYFTSDVIKNPSMYSAGLAITVSGALNCSITSKASVVCIFDVPIPSIDNNPN